MDGFELVPVLPLMLTVNSNPAAGKVFLTTDTQFASSRPTRS